MKNLQKGIAPIIIALIVTVVLGGGYIAFYYLTTKTVVESPVLNTYRNEKYGFAVALPESWQGYKIKESQKDIYNVSRAGGNVVVGQFPMIEIFHPLSTKENPRQNIPVFVFTIDQWEHIGNQASKDLWSVGAAPIPPSILAQNTKYVFALPARYNYAYLTGYEEVQKILDSKSFSIFIK